MALVQVIFSMLRLRLAFGLGSKFDLIECKIGFWSEFHSLLAPWEAILIRSKPATAICGYFTFGSLC